MKQKKINKIAIFVIELVIIFLYLVGLFLLIYNLNVYFFYIFILTLYLLNVFTMIMIWKQNRENSSKISWIVFFILFPIIGHFFYFTFGLSYVNKQELKLTQDKSYYYSFYNSQSHFTNEDTETDNCLLDYAKISNSNLLPAKFNMYYQGYEFFNVLIDNLEKAQENIDIVTYIIKPGDSTSIFLKTLLKKANQGVKIRWLIDYFGSGFMSNKYFKPLKKHPNVEIHYIGKIYYPFIVSKSFYRNHQKFIIIDNLKVYSGGNNISDEYVSFSKKYGHWIDLNYCVTGPYVNLYINHFSRFYKIVTYKEDDPTTKFKYYNSEDLQKYNSNAVLVTDSPVLSYSEAESVWLKAFANAKSSIKISTPYFSITTALWKQLIIALKSGVSVEIYIPGSPDKALIYEISVNEIKELVKYGLKVYVYNDHFLHSKLGLIDNKFGWFGTNNFDKRSMFSQYESMDLVQGEVIQDLINIFEEYKNNCSTISESEIVNKRPNALIRSLYKLLKNIV
ncbi:phospholipase D-like domain-containing protein [Mycoplasmopsis ciconiae]|uniref:Phospholipase D-like domain-containing protein n=1 Tax=Mycoplasmopsis ciconiae TaxID=561067 RepID=A0ABU7ML06_9BACT|nr:phospholipase D-like domain-containing protein [Mycoplasmopsis ciconiae]